MFQTASATHPDPILSTAMASHGNGQPSEQPAARKETTPLAAVARASPLHAGPVPVPVEPGGLGIGEAVRAGGRVFARRGFLAALGSFAGVMVFTPRASAGLIMDMAPRWWRDNQGGNLRSYADYLLSLRLGRISVGQILEAHAKCRGGTWNQLPPTTMWMNIGPTLRVVDRVAAELAEPVAEVVSVYRTPLYNAKCPGAANGSYHTRNNAIDVRFAASPQTVAAAATQLRARGLFHGGIGHYPTFTHMDTRGNDATW